MKPTLRQLQQFSLTYQEVASFAGPQEQLDDYIDWLAGDIAVLRHYAKEGETIMQCNFKFELRVNFADKEKLPEMIECLKQAARRAYSTAQLLSDMPKGVQVALSSDDWFCGPQEISLLDDVLTPEGEGKEVQDDPGISDELLNAFNK